MPAEEQVSLPLRKEVIAEDGSSVAPYKELGIRTIAAVTPNTPSKFLLWMKNYDLAYIEFCSLGGLPVRVMCLCQ